MATYLDLVTQLLELSEKIPFSQASAEQKALALRDVCDAVRYTYNNGDLSFKTGVVLNFAYTRPATGDPTKGTTLPANFMGFHETGKVYLSANKERGPLIYVPFHKIIDLTMGAQSTVTGLPTHYGLGGPVNPASTGNQREIILWPTPTAPVTYLDMAFQVVGPADVTDIAAADVEIPRIPATWHEAVIYPMARFFRKMDKGAETEDIKVVFSTAVKQMNAQEPHGREKPSRRPIHPAWR